MFWGWSEVFLSQKGGGRGIKEKSGIVPSTKAVKDTVVVSLYVVEEPVDNTMNTEDVNVGQTPTSPNVNPKPGTSYANLLTTGSSRKDRNFLTLFIPGGTELMWLFRWSLLELLVHALLIRIFSYQFSSMDSLDAMLENGPWFIRNNPLTLKKWNSNVNILKEDVGNVTVWVKLHGVPVTAFSEDGLSAIATKLGTPLMLDSYTSDMCNQSWDRSSYVRPMIEVRAYVKLKDTIVAAMPKLTGEGLYTCNEECPKNPRLGVLKILKKPSQDPKGVLIRCEATQRLVHSNPFDVINSVDNDGELGTNGGTSNLASNEANSSGSSFWKNFVETSSTSTTPIVDKIGKIEKLIMDGKVTLVDDDGIPLKKVNYPGDHDSEDEVESVYNDMARFMASEKVGFGTKSLLKQWRDSYENSDYDEDTYDDDMYEGQDIPDIIQVIKFYDNFFLGDIGVRDHMKK
ncbi:reverse transcriptase domain-containing protein [Tanacetum coccineum]